MYLSLNWLKDFVNIPESITPEELGLKLTMHTVEIDKIKKQAEKLDNDVIFEVDNKSITNRPDLWSHYGMAREIATFLNVKLKQIKSTPLPFLVKGATKINVKIEDFKLCQRYMAVALDEIKIEDSPEWMQKRLISVGMRPINNIVDITNYVMLEFGQPTHIFDLSKIFNKSIIIRNAKNNEIIKTLDKQDRKLDNSMLVIADKEKPIAIAGIMGGVDSEVDNSTTSILIESANFNPILIRKTSQKLGLRSEASIRFEKFLDPNLCEIALVRIVELIKEFCPKAKIISELKDEKKYSLNHNIIKLDLEWVNKIIGKKIKEKEIIKILQNLGFGIKKNKNILIVTVPSWRATRDITIAEDIVEEIVRIHGYNNIQSIMPKTEMGNLSNNQEHLLERKIKNILSLGAGLSEAHNYSFVSEEQINKLGFEKSLALKLVNPTVAHQTMLRTNLFMNLLENVKCNQAMEEVIKIFEIGNIYINKPGNIEKDNKINNKLPYQEKHLAFVLANQQIKTSISNNNDLFQQAKNIIVYLLNYLNCTANFVQASLIPNWADNKIYVNIEALGKIIGWVGKLSFKTSSSLNIKKEIVTAEINLQELFSLLINQPTLKYQELPKFPPIIRDLAFVVDEKILYNDIKQEIINFNALIKQVELFDVYQGNKLGSSKKNLAWHLTYQTNRTLTSLEVDKIQADLVEQLKKVFFIQIRDF
ncbi:MAG: phenylalanine--tRNA ligase subunit beta [Patescibacteria group bacterium]|nr:phenylalanine--tRNA ligase subunit beta [Patescibacteria group bacterium]MBU1870935.1 phenylalanine--tRNA ligase subunit beta [Patescibacteria group bacterium]